MAQDHWLSGFNYKVEEWFESDRYETLAICRAAFREAIVRSPPGAS